jgi:hypothetical protein
MIAFSCPHCKSSLELPDDLAGPRGVRHSQEVTLERDYPDRVGIVNGRTHPGPCSRREEVIVSLCTPRQRPRGVSCPFWMTSHDAAHVSKL